MSLLDFLFPKICFGCGSWGEYVCADCLDAFIIKDRQKCPVCEKDSVFGAAHFRCASGVSMDGLSIGFAYTGLLRTLLSRYKFSLVSDLSTMLVELWVSLPDLQDLAAKGPMVVTSVPLSGSRLRERGYNQAELLARKLADYLGWSYQEMLIKYKNTKKQSTLSRSQRTVNVHEVFRFIGETEHERLRILLVDDVWTTGATMRECSRVLKKSGASFVWGATIAG